MKRRHTVVAALILLALTGTVVVMLSESGEQDIQLPPLADLSKSQEAALVAHLE